MKLQPLLLVLAEITWGPCTHEANEGAEWAEACIRAEDLKPSKRCGKERSGSRARSVSWHCMSNRLSM